MHTVRGLVLMHDLIRTFDVEGALPVAWMDGLTLHSVETSRLCRMFAGVRGGPRLVAASRRRAGDHAGHRRVDRPRGVPHQRGNRTADPLGVPDPVVEAVARHTTGVQAEGPVDVSSAVALAHLVVEADLGPVCGPHDPAVLDEDQLTEAARDVITRWRRGRSPRPS
jgi:hypothetical protein